MASPLTDSEKAAAELYDVTYKLGPLMAFIDDADVRTYQQMVAAAGYDVLAGEMVLKKSHDGEGNENATDENTATAATAAAKTQIAKFYLARARELTHQWRALRSIELSRTMPSTHADLFDGGVSDGMRQIFEMTVEEASLAPTASVTEGSTVVVSDSAEVIVTDDTTEPSNATTSAHAQRANPYRLVHLSTTTAAVAFKTATAKAIVDHRKQDAAAVAGKTRKSQPSSIADDMFYYDGPIPMAPLYDTKSAEVSGNNNSNASGAATTSSVKLYDTTFIVGGNDVKRVVPVEKKTTKSSAPASLTDIHQWLQLENQMMTIEAMFNFPTPLFAVPHLADKEATAPSADDDNTTNLGDGEIAKASSTSPARDLTLTSHTHNKPLTISLHADVVIAKVLMQRAHVCESVFSLGLMPDQSHVLETTRRKLVRGFAEALCDMVTLATNNSGDNANDSPLGADVVRMGSHTPTSFDAIIRQSALLSTCGPSVTNTLICDDASSPASTSATTSIDNNNKSTNTNHNKSIITDSHDYYKGLIAAHIAAFRPFAFIECRYDLKDKLPKAVATQNAIGGNAKGLASHRNADDEKTDTDTTARMFNDEAFLTSNDIAIYEKFYVEHIAASCCGVKVLEFCTSTDMCVSLMDWLMLRQFKYRKMVETTAASSATVATAAKADIRTIAQQYTDTLLTSNTLTFTEARKDKYLMQRALEMANEVEGNTTTPSTADGHTQQPQLTSAKSSRVESFEEAIIELCKPSWQNLRGGASDDTATTDATTIPTSAEDAAAKMRAAMAIAGASKSPAAFFATLPSKCFPIVVKPVNGAGSEFVSLCYSWDELRNAFIVGRGSETILGRDASVMCLQEYLGGGAKTRSITFDPITGTTIRDDNYLPHLYAREPDYYKRSQEYVVDTVSLRGHHVFTDMWLSRKFPMKVKSTRMKDGAKKKLEERRNEKKEKEKQQNNNNTATDDTNKDATTGTAAATSAPATTSDALMKAESQVLASHDSDEAYDADGHRREVVTTTFVYDYQDLLLPLGAHRTKGIKEALGIGNGGDDGEVSKERVSFLTATVSSTTTATLSQTDINTKIIIDYTRRVLDAMDVRNGPSHCEIMLTFPDRTAEDIANNTYPTPIPKLIELNARPQGDMPRATPVIGTDQFMMLVHVYAFADKKGQQKMKGEGEGTTNTAACNNSPILWPPIGYSSLYGFDELYEEFSTITKATPNSYTATTTTNATTPTAVKAENTNNTADSHLVISPQLVPAYGCPPYVPLRNPNDKGNSLRDDLNSPKAEFAAYQLLLLRQRQTTASLSPYMLLSFDEYQYYKHYYGDNAYGGATTHRLACFRGGAVYDPTRSLMWSQQGGPFADNSDNTNTNNPTTTTNAARELTLYDRTIINDTRKGSLAPRPDDLLQYTIDAVGGVLKDGMYGTFRGDAKPATNTITTTTTGTKDGSSTGATTVATTTPDPDYTMRIIFMYCSDDIIFNEYGRRFLRDQLPCFVRFTRGMNVQKGPEVGFLNNSDKTIDIFSCPAAVILYGPRVDVERAHDFLRGMENACPSTLMSYWALGPTTAEQATELEELVMDASDNSSTDKGNNADGALMSGGSQGRFTANLQALKLQHHFLSTFALDGNMRLLFASDLVQAAGELAFRIDIGAMDVKNAYHILGMDEGDSEDKESKKKNTEGGTNPKKPLLPWAPASCADDVNMSLFRNQIPLSLMKSFEDMVPSRKMITAGAGKSGDDGDASSTAADSSVPTDPIEVLTEYSRIVAKMIHASSVNYVREEDDSTRADLELVWDAYGKLVHQQNGSAVNSPTDGTCATTTSLCDGSSAMACKQSAALSAFILTKSFIPQILPAALIAINYRKRFVGHLKAIGDAEEAVTKTWLPTHLCIPPPAASALPTSPLGNGLASTPPRRIHPVTEANWKAFRWLLGVDDERNSGASSLTAAATTTASAKDADEAAFAARLTASRLQLAFVEATFEKQYPSTAKTISMLITRSTTESTSLGRVLGYTAALAGEPVKAKGVVSASGRASPLPISPTAPTPNTAGFGEQTTGTTTNASDMGSSRTAADIATSRSLYAARVQQNAKAKFPLVEIESYKKTKHDLIKADEAAKAMLLQQNQRLLGLGGPMPASPGIASSLNAVMTAFNASAAAAMGNDAPPEVIIPDSYPMIRRLIAYGFSGIMPAVDPMAAVRASHELSKSPRRVSSTSAGSGAPAAATTISSDASEQKASAPTTPTRWNPFSGFVNNLRRTTQLASTPDKQGLNAAPTAEPLVPTPLIAVVAPSPPIIMATPKTRINFLTSSMMKDEQLAFEYIFASMGILLVAQQSTEEVVEKQALAGDEPTDGSTNQSHTPLTPTNLAQPSTDFSDRSKHITYTVGAAVAAARNVFADFIAAPVAMHGLRGRFQQVSVNLRGLVELAIKEERKNAAQSSGGSDGKSTSGEKSTKKKKSTKTADEILDAALNGSDEDGDDHHSEDTSSSTGTSFGADDDEDVDPNPLLSTSTVVYPAIVTFTDKCAKGAAMRDFPESIAAAAKLLKKAAEANERYLDSLEECVVLASAVRRAQLEKQERGEGAEDKYNETDDTAGGDGDGSDASPSSAPSNEFALLLDAELADTLRFKTAAEDCITQLVRAMEALVKRAKEFARYGGGLCQQMAYSNKGGNLSIGGNVFDPSECEDYLVNYAQELKEWENYAIAPPSTNIPAGGEEDDTVGTIHHPPKAEKGKRVSAKRAWELQYLKKRYERLTREFTASARSEDSEAAEAKMAADDFKLAARESGALNVDGANGRTAASDDDEEDGPVDIVIPLECPNADLTDESLKALATAAQHLTAINSTVHAAAIRLGAYPKRPTSSNGSSDDEGSDDDDAEAPKIHDRNTKSGAATDETPSPYLVSPFAQGVLSFEGSSLVRTLRTIPPVDRFYQTFAEEHGTIDATYSRDRMEGGVISSPTGHDRPAPVNRAHTAADDLATLINHASYTMPPPLYVRMGIFSALRECGLVGPLLLPDDHRLKN